SEFRTNSSRSEELLSNNPFRRCQSEVPVPPADFQRRQKKSPATERTKTCELPDQLSFSGKSWLLNPPRNDKLKCGVNGVTNHTESFLSSPVAQTQLARQGLAERERLRLRYSANPGSRLLVAEGVHRSESVELLNSDAIRPGTFKNHVRAVLHLSLDATCVLCSAQYLLISVELLLFANEHLIFLRSPINVVQLLLIHDRRNLPFRQAFDLLALPLGCDGLKAEPRLREQRFFGGTPSGQQSCRRSQRQDRCDTDCNQYN